MNLRSGKVYKPINIKNQPFKLILLREKVPLQKISEGKPSKINFDEASKEWRKNKVYLGQGKFTYKSIPFNS